MKILACRHFLLRSTSSGLYEISGDSHIQEDLDHTQCIKFLEMSEVEFNRASDIMLSVHPASIRWWSFKTEEEALAAWIVCIEP